MNILPTRLTVIAVMMLMLLPVAADDGLPEVDEPGSDSVQGGGEESLVEAAFARGKNILPSLEKIRGISFKRDVKMEVQTLDEFEAYLRKEVKRQYGEDGGKAVMDALHRLGFLKEQLDLGDAMSELMKSQAAAHYSPKDNAYYLLMPQMPALMLDMISAHELFHALQDQHFDLHNFVMADVEAIQDNSDAASAKQALVEGEATLVMSLHGVMSMTGMKQDQVFPMVAQQIQMQATMSYDEMINSLKQQSAMMKQLGMEQAAADMENLPRYFVEGMQALYLKGGAMVQHVYAQKGWEGVDALYKNPPDSMEQVLHPEKLMGERDKPVDVRIPNLLKKSAKGGWDLIEEDVAGELGIFSYLDMWRKDGLAAVSKKGAAGWGGDRYFYFHQPKLREKALVWRTVWDTALDAEEFDLAMRDSLKQRFENLQPLDGQPHTWRIDDNRFIRIRFTKAARQVDVIDADSMKTLQYFDNIL